MLIGYTKHMEIQSKYGKTVIRSGVTSGVYFFKQADEIVYIGKSDNVLSRISSGHPDKPYDEIEIHWMPKEELLAYETRQILIHRPRLNIERLRPRAKPWFHKGQ